MEGSSIWNSLISNSAVIAVIFIVVIRLANNALKASFFGLGSISVIAMAKKVQDSDLNLFRYLDDTGRLGISAQMLDKVLLCALIGLVMILVEAPPLVVIAGVLIYILIFDLLLPNFIAAFGEEVVTLLFPWLRLFYGLFSPITTAIQAIARIGGNRGERGEDETEDPEDIRAFIQAGRDEGIIEDDEQPLLRNLLNFSETIAREVMTPRTDMICVDLGWEKEKILQVFQESKHSRIPAYRETIDDIVGILRFKDVMDISSDSGPVEAHLKDTLYVPEQIKIDDLLRDMLGRRMQMVIVVDEYGGTSGLVTVENLVEEIVGDIHDEHEEPDKDEIIDLKDGSYLVDGKVLLDEFCELFKLDIEDDDVDTIAGYIFNQKGRIPHKGEVTNMGDVEVEIAEADDRRIYKVKVRPPARVTMPLH